MTSHDDRKAAKKRPWLKFYPQDWRGDAKLQSCSIGARGLWMEMVCIMHEAEPYGHLVIGGIAVNAKRLAMLAGISERHCMEFLVELGTCGVFTRDDQGRIFSRRMVRDEERSQKGRADVDKRWDRTKKGNAPDPSSPPIRDPNRVDGRVAITPEARDQNSSDGGSARAGAISAEAHATADAMAAACGFPDPKNCPLGWYGAAAWVQRCLTEGWPPQVMIEATRATAMRKRDGPIESFKYLEKPLARAVAEHSRPLPSVEASDAQTAPTHRRPPQPAAGFATIAARLRAGQSSD